MNQRAKSTSRFGAPDTMSGPQRNGGRHNCSLGSVACLVRLICCLVGVPVAFEQYAEAVHVNSVNVAHAEAGGTAHGFQRSAGLAIDGSLHSGWNCSVDDGGGSAAESCVAVFMLRDVVSVTSLSIYSGLDSPAHRIMVMRIWCSTSFLRVPISAAEALPDLAEMHESMRYQICPLVVLPALLSSLYAARCAHVLRVHRGGANMQN